jgi:dynactin complex subunit
MRDIYDTVHNTNGSMSTEFRNFAKESGIRELLRLSNIIEDNIHKGAALSEKLEAESENLWISRKKACEEKGRLSETKMTVPLMMFLMVLIVITVAPAMIEL